MLCQSVQVSSFIGGSEHAVFRQKFVRRFISNDLPWCDLLSILWQIGLQLFEKIPHFTNASKLKKFLWTWYMISLPYRESFRHLFVTCLQISLFYMFRLDSGALSRTGSTLVVEREELTPTKADERLKVSELMNMNIHLIPPQVPSVYISILVNL